MGWSNQGMFRGAKTWYVDAGNGGENSWIEKFDGREIPKIEGLVYCTYGASNDHYFRGRFEGELSRDEVVKRLEPIADWPVYAGKYGGSPTHLGDVDLAAAVRDGRTFFIWRSEITGQEPTDQELTELFGYLPPVDVCIEEFFDHPMLQILMTRTVNQGTTPDGKSSFGEGDWTVIWKESRPLFTAIRDGDLAIWRENGKVHLYAEEGILGKMYSLVLLGLAESPFDVIAPQNTPYLAAEEKFASQPEVQSWGDGYVAVKDGQVKRVFFSPDWNVLKKLR